MTRFIHAATSLEGGAGIAARNLHLAMLDRGWDSTVLTFSDGNNLPSIIRLKRNLIEKLTSKAITWGQIKFSRLTFFSLFSISSRTFLLFCFSQTDKQAVLVLHNCYNLLNLRSLTKVSKNFKSVIIIQHDMRWITGGCHSPVNCVKYEINCEECPLVKRIFRKIPQRVFDYERHLIKSITVPISYVSPSIFLMEETKKSHKMTQIPVLMGANLYSTPQVKRLAPRFSETITLGVATNGPFNLLKGDDILQEIRFELNKRVMPLRFEILEARKMDETAERMEKFYSSIDILLVLSRMDNSPNVIHEAHSVGIPVIATKIGGISELLNDEYDWGIEPGNLNAQFIVSGLPDYCERLRNFAFLEDSISSYFANNRNPSQIEVIREMFNKSLP